MIRTRPGNGWEEWVDDACVDDVRYAIMTQNKDCKKPLIAIGYRPSYGSIDGNDVMMNNLIDIMQNNKCDGLILLNLHPVRQDKNCHIPHLSFFNLYAIAELLYRYIESDVLLCYGNDCESEYCKIKCTSLPILRSCFNFIQKFY